MKGTKKVLKITGVAKQCIDCGELIDKLKGDFIIDSMVSHMYNPDERDEKCDECKKIDKLEWWISFR